MQDQNSITKNMQFGKQKQDDVLPQQKPVGEEDLAPKKRSPVLRALLIILTVLTVTAILAAAYLFLLVGEPDEESKQARTVQQRTNTTAMSPVSGMGDANLTAYPELLGEPVLYFYGGVQLNETSASDTAWNGGFARTVTLQYSLEDGTRVTLRSLCPAGAVTLLSSGSGWTVDGNRLYTLAGMNAARIEKSGTSIIFAQTDQAVYSVTFPTEKLHAVTDLLKGTALLKQEP